MPSNSGRKTVPSRVASFEQVALHGKDAAHVISPQQREEIEWGFRKETGQSSIGRRFLLHSRR